MLAEMLDDPPDDVVEADFWLVPDEGPDLRNVRDAPRHVLEPCFVRLVVRDELDRGIASGKGFDALAPFLPGFSPASQEGKAKS